MKLYKEEEIVKAIQYARERYDGWEMAEWDILKELNPIQLLNSEEQINKAADDDYKAQSSWDKGFDRRMGFLAGAKWMKDKILNQNK